MTIDEAHTLIGGCRFDRAEALLSGAEVTAYLADRAPPRGVALAQARLMFWTGRFDEARGLLPESCDWSRIAGTGMVVPAALMAWWRVRSAELRAGRAALQACVARDGTKPVLRLLELLEATLESRSDVAQRASTRFIQCAADERPSEAVAIVRLAASEACFAAGLRDAALHLLGPPAWWRDVSLLYRLLRNWLRACAGGHNDSRRALDRHVRLVRADGIKRWGWGSRAMPWLHALPALLQSVNEADDELSALKGGCRWLSAECGAEASAFLDADDGTTVAGTAPARLEFNEVERRAAVDAVAVVVSTRPGGVVVSSPVRYAGVRIGVLIASGPSDRAGTLAEAATSLAALCGPALRTRIDALALRRQSHERTPEIVGVSPAIMALRDAIGRAAGSPFPVLIEGESGSGKELVARAVHRLSTRRDRRFAALNCAALSDDLAETELFGHSRGAFTGAVGPRAGLFEEAHAGTLFLDEVGELSARAQAKLLRVLQEREVRRVGENAPRPIDVRVIAATNRPLRAMVAAAVFREDLLFRLAVVRIRVPPLRDRPEDIPLLAHAFWKTMAKGAATHAVVGPDAVRRLAQHHWPGNVRELQNAMAALVVMAPARGRVSARHVDHVLADTAGALAPPPTSLDCAREACERHAVASALVRHAGRRTAAARELGLTRQGLAKAMKRLRVDPRAPIEGVA